MASTRGLALVKTETSDERLFEAGLGREGSEALEILVLRYFNRIHAYLMVKGASWEDAEDLTQEVFLRVLRGGASFDDARGTFKSWLFKIATNLFIDSIRKRGSLRRVPLEECEAELGYLPQDVIHFDRCLQRLGPDLRAPFELFALGGLSASEIGHVLQLPEGTVYSRLHRARKKLRSKLDPGARVVRTAKKPISKQARDAAPSELPVQDSFPYEENQ